MRALSLLSLQVQLPPQLQALLPRPLLPPQLMVPLGAPLSQLPRVLLPQPPVLPPLLLSF